jgi:hypothetical protein
VAPTVTGTAGQCIVDELGRTRVGVMTLRRSFSDVAPGLSPSERAAWESQFVHQIGQTLGLVGLTVFGVPRPELDLSTPNAPKWTGPIAVAAYHAAGGQAGAIPITADLTSWQGSDPALADDVMASSLGLPRRISPTTIGALTDRGYQTAADRAEPAPITAGPVAANLTSGTWRGTRWVVRADGRAVAAPHE